MANIQKMRFVRTTAAMNIIAMVAIIAVFKKVRFAGERNSLSRLGADA